MRTCRQSTIKKIAGLSRLPAKPAWLRTALYDARHGKPMSLERERRMLIALGFKLRKRKRYYRPCVDCEIGEMVKEMGIDVNYVLLKYLEEREALP